MKVGFGFTAPLALGFCEIQASEHARQGSDKREDTEEEAEAAEDSAGSAFPAVLERTDVVFVLEQKTLSFCNNSGCPRLCT